MLQLTILGQGPRETTAVIRYPFRIGRAPGDQLRIEAPGVWERHCTLEWRGADGIQLVGHPEAMTAVNGQRVNETRVRNGDVLEIGGIRLLISVSPLPQRSFRLLEWLFWSGYSAAALLQVYLMLWGLP